jgi:glyoxylase-like metal-dependent hydrolase (beta-lactamase superfamily II)/ferredoxin
MADIRKRLPANAPGEFFVDSTCIDCDTCRQIAPAVFEDGDGHSYVRIQPRTAQEERDAARAVVACPTASIGGARGRAAAEAAREFPLELAPRVYYCGFHSPKSFGASSYFVRHADGNWLVDSPRYAEHLVRRIAAMGGIRRIFLTHRDDVADAAKYAQHFGAERVIHRLELSAQPGAERVLDGFAPLALGADFLAIPTPGHTRGHCALLYADRYLFAGDHLWWSPLRNRLHASRGVCWHSWAEQTASVALLRDYPFEWVLPGHGRRVQLTREQIQRQLSDLSDEMRRAA